MKRFCLFSIMLALTASWQEEVAEKPAPLALSEEAVDQLCQMNVLEHDRPKAQVFLAGLDHPIWFTSVRDMLTFRKLPSETGDIQIAYVSDTAAGDSCRDSDPAAWVEAENAFLVIGFVRLGGMGVTEAVPFAEKSNAEAFVKRLGGEVAMIGEIGEDWLFPEMGPTS
ncbi:MAG: nitrous oxide reductase accessory protein NosL [Geminicoccaceae bacterium]